MSADLAAVEAYLAALPADKAAPLVALRARIAALLAEMDEDFTERMSYNMPGFELRGKMIAGYAANTSNCGYYPHSGTTLDSIAEAIGPRSRTKSALHFTAQDPISDALLRCVLEARLAEIAKA